MKILVLGGTGPLGQEILKQASALGHEITALARNPDTLKDVPGNVTVVKGDLMDISSLKSALNGQQAVISAFGTKLLRKPTTLLSDATRNLVEAMTDKGVKRLICVTGIGAGDSKGHGGFLYDNILEPFLLHEIYKDKTRQEDVIRKSSLDWVIARPAILTNGPATRNYRTVTDLEGFKSSKISRADVAAFLLEQLSTDKWLRKLPVLSNA